MDSRSAGEAKFSKIGQIGLLVYALIFPLVTGSTPCAGNFSAYSILVFAGIGFSVLHLMRILSEPVASLPANRASMVISVVTLGYLCVLLTATFGFSFDLLLLVASWIAVLATVMRPDFLREYAGQRIAVLLPSLIAVVLLACILTVHQHTSILGSSYRRTGLATFLGCVVIFFTTISCVRSAVAVNRLVLSLLAGGVIVSVVALLQFYNPDEAAKAFTYLLHDPRPSGTMGHPNWFGTYICILLPLSMSELLAAEGKFMSTVSLAASGLLYSSLLVCQTRGAWLAFAVFALWFAIRQRKYWKKTFILAALFGLVTLLLVSSREGMILHRWRTFDREIGDAAEMSPSTGSGRFAFWMYCLERMPSHILLGSGLDTYEKVEGEGTLPPHLDKAHSIFFEYALTIGCTGLVLYVSFLWSCVAPAGTRSDGLRGWGIRAAILTYFAQGIFIHDTIRTWPLVWLVVGLGVVNRHLKTEPIQETGGTVALHIP